MSLGANMRGNLFFFSFLMVSCSSQGSGEDDLISAQSRSVEVSQENSEERLSMGNGGSVAKKDGGLSKACGGFSFSISKTGEDTAVLSRTRADGTESEVAVPTELQGYQPVGLGCAVSAEDGRPYFVVQYGEIPYGCSVCEWFYIYDADGKSLSDRKIIFKDDEVLSKKYSNNDEYEQALMKLALTHPEMEYLLW